MEKKILIIDDDSVVVRYLEQIFNDHGYKTLSASNGIEGFEILKKVKPDLITLDLQMPEEWGPRFYRKLTKSKEYRDIPVIVITGLDGEYAIKDAIALIKKPFDPKVLLDIVQNTIG